MIPTSYISVRAFEGSSKPKKTRRVVNCIKKECKPMDRATSLAFIAGMMR